MGAIAPYRNQWRNLMTIVVNPADVATGRLRLDPTSISLDVWISCIDHWIAQLSKRNVRRMSSVSQLLRNDGERSSQRRIVELDVIKRGIVDCSELRPATRYLPVAALHCQATGDWSRIERVKNPHHLADLVNYNLTLMLKKEEKTSEKGGEWKLYLLSVRWERKTDGTVPPASVWYNASLLSVQLCRDELLKDLLGIYGPTLPLTMLSVLYDEQGLVCADLEAASQRELRSWHEMLACRRLHGLIPEG